MNAPWDRNSSSPSRVGGGLPLVTDGSGETREAIGPPNQVSCVTLPPAYVLRGAYRRPYSPPYVASCTATVRSHTAPVDT